MSIIQFIRILWAHRMLTALTTTATLIGAVIAILIIPPTYQAKTRVMLNMFKPDPITGEMIGATSGGRTYLATQSELIKDVGVAGLAVDQLGWSSNPEVVKQYKGLNGADNDLRRALAQQIVSRTNVDVVTGTNMLEISFRAATPDQARSMANALREAFVESTLSGRRRDAARNANWFSQQAAKERDLLSKANTAKTDYEREAGIIMQDEKIDVETARLRALSMQGAGLIAPVMPAPVMQNSATSLQMAQLDNEIAQAQRTLGPNHPQMIQLRAQRAALQKVANDEQAVARANAAAAARAASSSGGLDAAVRQQTSRVIADRDKIEHLNQLQGEVNLHRDQMEKALVRAGEFNKEAAVADSGIAVVNEAVTPTSPSFPKKGLILGGALGLGAALGLFLSLLVELLGRRVRGGEDLEAAVDAPVLAVISAFGDETRSPTLLGRKLFALHRTRAAAA